MTEQNVWGLDAPLEEQRFEPEQAPEPEPEPVSELGQEPEAGRVKPRRSKRSVERKRAVDRRRAGSLSPAQAKRAYTRVTAVLDAAPAELASAAALAGCEDDSEQVALAILTGRMGDARKVLDDLREAAETEDAERGILLAVMGRPRMEHLWRLVRAAGADLPERAPESDLKTALRLGEAIGARDEDQRHATEAGTQLLEA